MMGDEGTVYVDWIHRMNDYGRRTPKGMHRMECHAWVGLRCNDIRILEIDILLPLRIYTLHFTNVNQAHTKGPDRMFTTPP